MRILIVENEALVAEDIKDILEVAGHQVVGIAVSIGEAVTLAKEGKPQLAVLDVDLRKGESGLTVAGCLASDFGIPSIFLTGRVDFQVRAMALPVQPLAFLSKPFHTEELLSAVRLAHR